MRKPSTKLPLDASSSRPLSQGEARCDFPGGSAEALWTTIQRSLALPNDTRLSTGHDYMPGGREPRWESSVPQQRTENIHLRKANTEAEFISLRESRDRTLPMPKLNLQPYK